MSRAEGPSHGRHEPTDGEADGEPWAALESGCHRANDRATSQLLLLDGAVWQAWVDGGVLS